MKLKYLFASCIFGFKNLIFIISIQELRRIITGETKGHLGQIVCTK